MKRMFVGLNWKVFFLLMLVLLAVNLTISFILVGQWEEQFYADRQEANERDLAALNGAISVSYNSLLEVAHLLPLLQDGLEDPQIDPLTYLAQNINLSFSRMVGQGLADTLYLYDDNGRMVNAWGEHIAIPRSIIRDVLAQEYPVQKMQCSYDCLRFVAAPLLIDGEKVGAVVVGRFMLDVVMDFREQVDVDVGLLLRVEPEVADLPGFGLNVKSLTHHNRNLPLLQKLSNELELPDEGGSFMLSDGGREYEVVFAQPEGLDDGNVYWVMINDISAKRADLDNAFTGSILLGAFGLFCAAILQTIVLRRPLNYIAMLAQQLPKLAESSRIPDVLYELSVRERYRSLFRDELDTLMEGVKELGSRLLRLERSVSERTLRLEEHSDALAKERDFVASLLNTAQTIILTQNQEGRIMTLNSFGRRLVGLSEDLSKEVQLCWSDLPQSAGDSEGAQDIISQVLMQDAHLVQVETVLTDADGVERNISWLHSRLNNVPGEGPSILSIGLDITERKHAEKRLTWLASHDPLTRQPNRMLFFEQLERALPVAAQHNNHVAVMFCDLDGFKDINDTLGHGLGDQLLNSVAERLQGCLRQNDLLARLGGDEFTILLEGLAHSDDVEQVANKIRSAFAEPFKVSGLELHVTMSIGISIYPEHGQSADELIKNADIAMYQAKDAGKDRFCRYQTEMSVIRIERFEMLNDMRRALEQGDFYLHYQPQIEVHSGEVVGLEALLRWNHPDAGPISPARFVPLAEEMGLIVPLGEWVLREACRQRQIWREQGMSDSIKVSVNLAGQQILNEGLLDTVSNALKDSGLPAYCLDLEVTEGFVISQPEATIGKLQKLRQMGITLAMDDFGTGYSSLSYLKKLPINTLKIDQGFVRDLGHDKDDEAIVVAIITLCKSLGIRVLAEGVETHEQLNFLMERGCSIFQGYYYSRPLPAQELFSFVEQLNSLTLSD